MSIDNFLAYNSLSLHYLDFLRKQLVDKKLEQELEAIIQHGVRSGSVSFEPYSLLKLPVLQTVLVIGGK